MDNRRLDELDWSELEQSIENFIAADGISTDDLSASEFFTLWTQFEQERQQRMIEIQGELVGEKVVLSLTASNIGPIHIQGPEILLPDGTRIILRFQSHRSVAA